jgi:hypothetical protein
MSNKTKVGIALVLAGIVGAGVGIATHNIGAWIGMGVAIGIAVGLAITKRG